MMRFHPRSAAIVLGGALAMAAATSAPALAQKHTNNSSHPTTSGQKGSSQHGTPAHGHNAAKSQQQGKSSNSASSSHGTTSTGLPKNPSGSKGSSGSPPAASGSGHKGTSTGHPGGAGKSAQQIHEHHARHELERKRDHLRREVERLEREFHRDRLKAEHHAKHERERQLERLRKDIERLERDLRKHPLNHDHDRSPQQNASPQVSHSHHAKYARVEVSLPHADAVVLFNGSKTTASGTHRVFKTPELSQGKRYTYRVVAMWHHSGTQIREERTVHVTAGATAHVHFHHQHHAPGQTGPGATGSASGPSAPANTKTPNE
jgi:uncharacterized protein (TIGR03000 family)